MYQTVLVVGSGNLAWHWLNMLQSTEGKVCVYARQKSKSEKLAQQFNAQILTDLNAVIDANPQLVILAISDSSIEEVSSPLSGLKSTVVHCSGGTPVTVLARHFTDYGVVYPLQTFTSGQPLNYSNIPFFTEASGQSVHGQLTAFLQNITKHIYPLNSEQRSMLHLIAVMANNFGNHLFDLAHQLCQSSKFDFNWFEPLLQETVNKAIRHLPAKAQTGPAVRGDVATMQQHGKLLGDYPEMAKVYKVLSNSIQYNFKPNEF